MVSFQTSVFVKPLMSKLMRLWYLSHRRPAKAQASLCILRASAQSRQGLRCSHTWSMEVDEGSDQNQTSSPTGWLRMRVWRMSLRRTKSTIILWAGSFSLYHNKRLQTIPGSLNSFQQRHIYRSMDFPRFVIRWSHFNWIKFLLQKISIALGHIMRKLVYAICEQLRHRSACASAQSDQRLCCSLLR